MSPIENDVAKLAKSFGSNDFGSNDLGSNDLGSNDLGSNDLGSNDDVPKDLSTSATSYWRSLEHLADSPEVQQYIDEEFPSLALAIARTDRRQFMRLLGASFALAGITSTGCRRWPVEEVRPHTSRPEGFTPGVAEHYATAIELGGVSTGILAKSYDGRPIKIEGNPDHPFSLGAASVFAQASVLELYDPDRSRHPMERQPLSSKEEGANRKRTWGDFHTFATPHFQSLKNAQGDGLALLIQPTASPTMKRLLTELQQSMPKAKLFQYTPLHRDNEFAGCQSALGQVFRSQYDLQKADVILAFEADLLGSHPGHLKHARDWAAGRRSVDQGKMNRLIVVEPGMSVTGSVADVRLPIKPSLIEKAVAYLAYRFDILSEKPGGLSKEETAVLERAALDLHKAGASGVVAVGPAQSALAHQLVYAINEKIGCVGTCISYTEEPLSSEAGSISSLSEQLQGNVINTLVILGGNPVYDAPADAGLDLASTESRPLTSIHLSLHDNETSAACTWHLPVAHFLESWGDGRAWDGTYTLQQPLIEPLYEGKSTTELLALLLGQTDVGGRKLVRSTFDGLFNNSIDRDWETALHAGVKSGSQFKAVTKVVKTFDESTVGTELLASSATGEGGYEIRFVGDSKTFDGRFANNAWLQELPEPLTKLTWDNAALISQADAESLGVATGDVIRIDNIGNAIEIAAYIMPGQARGCISLPLGYGRTRAGHIGNGVGIDVYPIRTSRSSYTATDCIVTNTGHQYQLVTTQVHHLMDAVGEAALQKRVGAKGKPGLIVHEALFSDFEHDQHAVHGEAHAVHKAPLFDLPNSFDTPHKWGMSIDLNACIGCSGCVLACQAENNIPVVGKANVAVTREMHWLRIDRYFKGDAQQPDVVHLPMACAHCENAPCEQVCPVAATVHDAEGLNSMVYNRCIGTRYCANNCPFKVRRFNYFDYQASDPRTPAKPWLQIPDQQQMVEISPLKKMVHNPEVTVRMRGVMEKCTFCVQRIVDARIHAKNENAQGLRDSDLVVDGEVQTACQATCPTAAIVFGDLNDPKSAVSQAKENVRSYEILEELNLGARTTYLAKVRNRNTT